MERPAATGRSVTRSRLQVGQGYFGPIPDELWEILAETQRAPIAVSSNIARQLSAEFALAASMGWLSVVEPDGRSYSRTWKITPEGAFALRNRSFGT